VARLLVVSNPGLADGYRLAGAPTLATHPGPEAATVIRSAVADADVGLLLVTADLWQALDARTRGDLERLARPIVLPIPAGVVTDVSTRRQLLGEMLERAIGYRIELTTGAPE
jgi:vacuolar-type H+-ATPase subunit F/Vma7